MSDDQDKDSKTEDPTEKKMRDAVEKGNTPSSREVPIFASALAVYLYVVFFLPSGIARIGETLRDLFEQPDQWKISSATDVVSLFVHLGWEASALLLPAVALIMLFGVGSNVLQNVPSFVLERIRPQASRVSLAKGWERLFSVTGVVEFGKSLFKIVIVSTIMVFSLKSEYFGTIDALFSDPQVIFVKFATILKKMMVVILLATFVLAVVDFFWTRYHWHTQLRMTKQEIKDEHKQSQGDPIIKARQRSIARDRARRRMINNVPRATLVITNPTHYAVALRYVREENEAPVVIAKGQDLVALKIRELARENDIPIFEDPPLARSMFAQVSVDSVIPSIFYKAVAELVHRVYSAKAQKRRVR
ncbi:MULTISPECIES: flagellar biosynthesis protein FlhB [Alphaproteobacteria]|uniref:Flagellar biosynthetic protein FlhB n=2 Tax=Alphaproteobacteria TaxID=28211 RepID=A0A512HDD0_9HYPH|nr:MULTISPECIES: flagellar biosynthesis protein FlhB [Alphaproteobacteria]GEO83456.1 flagellar biosynthesis protein FlhB [Ciceribacter naphthalenivorans]GLR24394.1 flagellar biosynthesis protein FlhB [Ciceribacter naphthalenivorans]GLT07250.1 flagellar biosynthesis protein FlhB [Sphingomonas psychrolutea]